ncbi:jg7290 [Pararge aegeria aegeria]|uniref:Jg7290 protein n=1 Tax=Pararge aegeria aegeria TaxID=348720 RepID=A0A8S4QBL8_9NEOP|nr:jg7290 [Pararge aegeria aegeria]
MRTAPQRHNFQVNETYAFENPYNYYEYDTQYNGEPLMCYPDDNLECEFVEEQTDELTNGNNPDLEGNDAENFRTPASDKVEKG